MTSFFATRWSQRHIGMVGILLCGFLALLALAIWHFASRPEAISRASAQAEQSFDAGPPWRYGRADARFTLVLYADLECPFCKSYYPIVKAWVDRHSETSLQWHHLPLSMHEPAATQQARLAECAGETAGHAAFWESVTWMYQHTRSDGQGIPDSLPYPKLTPAIQACLSSDRPEATVQTQATEGTRDGITATPTLKLIDSKSGKTLVLPGPVEGDALLSALDLVSSADELEPAAHIEMPADVVGDMPR